MFEENYKSYVLKTKQTRVAKLCLSTILNKRGFYFCSRLTINILSELRNIAIKPNKKRKLVWGLSEKHN